MKTAQNITSSQNQPRRQIAWLRWLTVSIALSMSLVVPFRMTVTRALAAPPIHCTAVTEIPLSECTALIDLYMQTDGPHWTKNHGWNTTTKPCSTPWFGITCYNGHVWKIELSINKLNGTVPETLNHLTNLQHLYLDNNALSGSIPDLSSLTTLTYLYLSHNHLSGPIPDLSGLTSLSWLLLDNNALSGSISAIRDLTHVFVLNLSHNQLSGQITDLSKTVVQFLDLSHNQLSGPIPDLRGPMLSLDLSYNQLSGSVPPSITQTSFGTPIVPATIEIPDVYTIKLCGGSNHLTPPDSATDAFIAAHDKSWTLSVGCIPTTDPPTPPPLATLTPNATVTR